MAISSDDIETLKKFRKKYGPDLSFIADPKGDLIKRFGVKTPVLTFAQRTTFVIDQAGVIKAVHTGGEAIDASKAVAAVQQCQLPASK